MSWWIWSVPSERSEAAALLVCVVGGEPAAIAEGRRTWLTARERARLVAIGTPERQTEWLSGRLTAKYAVWFTAADIRPRPSPRQIEVVADARGAPRAHVWRDGLPSLTAEISLAHCTGAVACATSGLGFPGPVGVDVELASGQVLELVDRFTLPAERRCLAGSPRPELTATVLWALKEAAVKCLGGRLSRRRAFDVSLDERQLRAWVVLRERVETAGSSPLLVGGFRILGQHVVAWVSEVDRPVRLHVLVDEPARGAALELVA
jgi:phosphopantetheinyl transferase